MIRAVIFDFGRVISAQKPASLFRSYEDQLGLTPGTINTIMFDSVDWHEALLGRKTMAEFWTLIGPRLGLRSPVEIEAFRRRYYAAERINLHVLNLITRLHGSYKLAVCSNSPPGLSQWLVDWRIHHLFDAIFCSGDEGIAKPDQAAYRITLERLGVRSTEAAFVDDAVENVEAASRHGLEAILFTDAPALEKELSRILPVLPGTSAGKIFGEYTPTTLPESQ